MKKNFSNKKIAILVIAAIGIIAALWLAFNRAPLANNPTNNMEPIQPEAKKTYATIETSLGTIKIELFKGAVPNTAANFIKLANDKFYDGTKFHRVIKGFMIQGGDPLTKDDSKKKLWGTGGPGYRFADEPFTGEYTRGTVAMANAGPNTNGSQFFIMHQDYSLSPAYVIFGRVTDGMDAVDKIAELPTGQNDMPLDPPAIKSVTIIEQ